MCVGWVVGEEKKKKKKEKKYIWFIVILDGAHINPGIAGEGNDARERERETEVTRCLGRHVNSSFLETSKEKE